MLIGEYHYNLDEKKRLLLPAKIRKDLGKKGVLTKGLEGCLFLYPKKEWEKLVKKISDLPLGKKETRHFQRMLLAGAVEVPLDKQGRILIPDYLKKYADLGKKVVIVGVHTHLEIWAEEKWKEYQKKCEKEMEEFAEKLSEIGF